MIQGFDLDAFVTATLAEDLGPGGDITSAAVIPVEARFVGTMASRDAITVAGLPIADAFFRRLDPDVVIERLVEDGASVPAGTELLRLSGQARAMLTADEPSEEVRALLARLFPVVHPDDEEREAEYQRLMRDELVQSKLAAFAIVEDALDGGGDVDEGGLVAFMQSVNSIRLVLGTMLGVTDDADADEVAPGYADSPEYALYGYLSHLLELSVRALSGG